VHLGKPYACMLWFAASACAARPAHPLPRPSAPAPQPLLQSELQELSERHCSACHQSSVSREKPAALAVFDLDQVEWSAGLAAAQFGVFYQRMQGELDAPTRGRLLAYTERAARSAPKTPLSAAHPPE
jgi:hypothetical protein